MDKEKYEEELGLEMARLFLPLTKKESVQLALAQWKIVIEWNDEKNCAQVVLQPIEQKGVPPISG